MYADASTQERKEGADARAHSVIVDLTRPVMFGRLWNLSGVNLTQWRLSVRSSSGVSGRDTRCAGARASGRWVAASSLGVARPVIH